jgi:hypothetical protein
VTVGTGAATDAKALFVISQGTSTTTTAVADWGACWPRGQCIGPTFRAPR